MTVGDWIKQAEERLKAAGTSSVRLDAELILAHVLGQNRTWITTHSDEELETKIQTAANELLARRANREPLVHLTGVREFYGLEFKITPDVLTPRVETEQMAEWAIKYAPKDSKLIDIGTGSGAIAIAIATHRTDLAITATEVNDEALAVAQDNAKRHKTPIEFIKSDLWAGLKPAQLDAVQDEGAHRKGSVQNGTQSAEHSPQRRNASAARVAFATIVTNLPYLQDDADLMPEVRREPAVALFGGPDGLDLYRRFLKDLPKYLEPGGYLFTECDPWQHEALITEAAKVGLKPIEQSYFILGFQLNQT